jgi:hypothetical protein
MTSLDQHRLAGMSLLDSLIPIEPALAHGFIFVDERRSFNVDWPPACFARRGEDMSAAQ